MPKCPQCGARNPRENTVCDACGAVLGVEPTPAEQAIQAAAEEATSAWMAEATPVQKEEAIAQDFEEVGEETVAEEEANGDEEEILKCARCQEVIPPGEELVVPGRVRGGGQLALCPKCVAEIEKQFAAETQDIQVGRGILFGLGAAIVCGVSWYWIETLTGWPLALLGFIAGWLIAEAVRFGAGRKRGRVLQWIALGLTALTILGTQYAIYASTEALGPAGFFQAFGEHLQDIFTLILYGLALWQAYSTPAPRRLVGARRG